jgi:transcriptional regulator of arginine metabolism
LDGKAQRQAQIVELIQRNRIDSQDQLLDLIEAEGLNTTQSTLSRDLRELGVIKGADGYRLPDGARGRGEPLRALAATIREWFTSVDVGGNIVVLRCPDASDASRAASEIDRARPHHVVSAVAIGETVLVIGRTPAYARDVARALRRT